ncbi:MAG: complex I NDUFA9 subunit family protein [Candidatus Thiodiazotropha sp. (ex Lucinoma annulata)]|nr:complex I NDUFA9 subunit family protein [Candidatus Thiodiazotropha sp. (ex Lucinoma borealis)]MCU7840288.1 complex I NDUFA9 subunit family protein [Candidatus Thiodiazotropha sp. (ex Troendleina suluensis)]MCU7883266.1 complex I NDUFA9 subunit family protein [Candidatus Thiodiazotropha sp. (ex Lucinoma annulata)]MCU7946633.1 complex I NDUFA9 subunit family protein [Candidatus Thiodiazotropha sp. (ex Cardiolucina cf. quadrata)]MCU7864959.1 complex I NDUFA9 subunit family protein [Candidatus 
MKKVCILGGSGFVGYHLVAKLSSRGFACRLLIRHPQRHALLKVCPNTELIQTHRLDTKTLTEQFTDCHTIINLIGILNESKTQKFRDIHIELVDTIVDAAIQAGASRLLHMSALNADAGKGLSKYLRSKGEGENRAHTYGSTALDVTSFRPSVIFGPGDSFFNRFASLLRLSPFIFPLASPQSRFAPVFVDDVTEAFVVAMENPETVGKHYELCGPQSYSLSALVKYTADTLGIKRWVIPLNDGLSRLQAHLLGHVPGRPFTLDNFLSMQSDSICQQNGLSELGIQPQAIESHVPLYLMNRGYRGRFDHYRSQ